MNVLKRQLRPRSDVSGALSEYPATYRQAQILRCLSDPSCSDIFRDHWLIAHAMIIRPRVDHRRLQRAARAVMERHDSLRIRFRQVGQNWRAVIGGRSDESFREVDLTSQTFSDEADFHARIRAIARAPMDALTGHLAEVVLVRCGERGDVLIIRVHHTVADGYGMVLLTEDMFKGLIGQLPSAPAMSHAEFVRKWELPTGEAAEANERYWADTLRDFPHAPEIGRKAKGLEPNWHVVGWRDNRKLVVHASQASRERLAERAAKLNLTADIMLYTAHAQALCELYDVDRIAHSTASVRSEPDLARFCGDRATRVPFIHSAFDRTSGIEAAAIAKREKLLAGIEHLPSLSLQPDSPFQLGLIERGCHPNQFITMTPFATTLARRSDFREVFFAGFETERRLGPVTIRRINVDKHTGNPAELALRMAVPGDPSIFNISYDVDAYDRDELRALAEAVCRIADLEPTNLVFA